CIAIDPPLAQRIDSWRSREMFIAYFGERLELLRFSKGGVNRVVEPWRALVVHEALRAIQDKNVDELVCWLRDELSLLSDECVGLQVELLERATWTNGEPMIRALFDLDPAILRCAVPPQSGALEFAMEYGHAHLVPLLTRIWSMPDDLPHAAGMGILARVKQWFDEAGRPALRDLGTHFPVNNPTKLRHLQWDDGNEQCVLDTALAWACMNKQLEVAAYLVERGADLNTNWGTHEPAGILHECAMHGNYEAAQFLIDRGVDLGKLDYRWRATARGWAHYAAKDQQMADFLLAAERAKGGDNDIEGS
ncbi:MAG TPA: ankyrin repeat domain-containing protein, partial [Steroidobacteraceae bacterium]|nr:ankyrin repeat domain-containing protein [Steroidobacteraceae bacterium]